jgi:hypothetical protein
MCCKQPFHAVAKGLRQEEESGDDRQGRNLPNKGRKVWLGHPAQRVSPTNEMSVFRAADIKQSGSSGHEALQCCRDGADYEDRRSDVETVVPTASATRNFVLKNPFCFSHNRPFHLLQKPDIFTC